MSLTIKNYKPLTVPKSIKCRKVDKIGNEKIGDLFEIIINDEAVLTCTYSGTPTPVRITRKMYDGIEEEFLAQEETYPYIVRNFIYGGFSGKLRPGFTKYKAGFINWTGDPGIARMLCSDGRVRLIPTFALKGKGYSLPEDTTKKEDKIMFGSPSKS